MRHAQPPDHPVAQWGLGQHPAHRVHDHAFRLRAQEVAQTIGAEAARVPAVPVDGLTLGLPPGDANLLRIDHDDSIT